MDDMSDFWRIVSGGRAESTRQRLERHDRRMSRLYRLLALPLIVGGLTVMLAPGLNTWWNDRTLTHEAHAVGNAPAGRGRATGEGRTRLQQAYGSAANTRSAKC